MLTNENVTVTSKVKNAPTLNKYLSSANEDIQFSKINSSEQCPESDLHSTDKIEKNYIQHYSLINLSNLQLDGTQIIGYLVILFRK